MKEPHRIAPWLARTIPAVFGMALYACSGTDASPGAYTNGGGESTGGQSGIDDEDASGGNVTFGGSSTTGGSTATGASSDPGGTSASGGDQSTGGSSGAGGTKASGGTASAGGARTSTGGSLASGGASYAGSTAAMGGSFVAGGAASAGGSKASGGTRATGGATASGGTNATGGTKSTGTSQIGGAAGSSGTGCPYTGHVSYTLATVANPNSTEQNAYTLIRAAMDKAVTYYNCYTNITKALNVSYNTSVGTADGNINGSIRFGSNTSYMDYRTAMHEISHTVGIGTSGKWASCVDMTNKLYTCNNAKQQLTAINSRLATPADGILHADNQHFWPYGINQQSEVKSESDLIYHCEMVMAILKDLG